MEAKIGLKIPPEWERRLCLWGWAALVTIIMIACGSEEAMPVAEAAMPPAAPMAAGLPDSIPTDLPGPDLSAVTEQVGQERTIPPWTCRAALRRNEPLKEAEEKDWPIVNGWYTPKIALNSQVELTFQPLGSREQDRVVVIWNGFNLVSVHSKLNVATGDWVQDEPVAVKTDEQLVVESYGGLDEGGCRLVFVVRENDDPNELNVFAAYMINALELERQAQELDK